MIIYLTDKIKESVFLELQEMLADLKEYDLVISLTISELKNIYDELFNLYLRKDIIYEFRTDIITYFNEIIALAIENNVKNFTYEYVIETLKFCHSIMSPVEIKQKDISRILRKAKRKC